MIQDVAIICCFFPIAAHHVDIQQAADRGSLPWIDTEHLFEKNVEQDRKNSHNVCLTHKEAKERKREIDREEIRQIIRENKKMKKHARIQEIQIEELRNIHTFVIV